MAKNNQEEIGIQKRKGAGCISTVECIEKEMDGGSKYAPVNIQGQSRCNCFIKEHCVSPEV